MELLGDPVLHRNRADCVELWHSKGENGTQDNNLATRMLWAMGEGQQRPLLDKFPPSGQSQEEQNLA